MKKKTFLKKVREYINELPKWVDKKTIKAIEKVAKDYIVLSDEREAFLEWLEEIDYTYLNSLEHIGNVNDIAVTVYDDFRFYRSGSTVTEKSKKANGTLVLEDAEKIDVTINDIFEIKIPVEIYFSIVKADREITETEFSLLAHAEIDYENNKAVITEIYVPKQKCTSGSTEVLEAFDAVHWNVYLHKHPKGMKSFSQADYENNIKSFPISLLICEGEIVDGIIKMSGKLKIAGKEYDATVTYPFSKIKVVVFTENEIDLVSELKEKIEKPKQQYYYSNRYNRYSYSYPIYYC